jgi:hypothetical protein
MISIPLSWTKENSSEYLELLKTSLKEHLLLIVTVCVYSVFLLCVAHVYNVQNGISISLYSSDMSEMLVGFIAICLIVDEIKIMFIDQSGHLCRNLWLNIKRQYLAKERIIAALPCLLFLPIFFSTFTSFKTILPVVHHYSLDSRLASIDRFLHGGIEPWRLLQPIVGYPLITFLLNFFYDLWFFIMFLLLLWQVFTIKNKFLRMRFLLTFIMSWMIIGTVAATILSSTGPCYYQQIVGSPDPYVQLFDYLHKVDKVFPVWALDTQEMLWKLYTSNTLGLGGGISAMPSMHVSMALLFLLLVWQNGHFVRYMFLIYLIIIQVGSVHLGWHYAIDGYVSIFCTLILWIFIGWLLRTNKFAFATG